MLVDFYRFFANARSRAFRVYFFAQEEVPASMYECPLAGARTSEINLSRYLVRG